MKTSVVLLLLGILLTILTGVLVGIGSYGIAASTGLYSLHMLNSSAWSAYHKEK